MAGSGLEDAAVASRPLEPLLALVNKLQEACALAGDTVDPAHRSTLPSVWETLPQIVVVGGQSSGKSSVLEAIVGRDFLPRGAGICTRRPLVLQLHATSPAPEAAEGFPPSPGGSEALKPRSSSRGDTARFLHKPDVVFDDFSKVRDEIEAETARALGPGKAVSSEPIMLSIRSAHVPNLTLVDMPGLTKVATADQPASIVRDIEDMARAFVAPPNVVIVAVSPANADIATSDGVRIAREVDPGFRRTIGVLTKLDLMDAGTDARDVLEQRALRLRLGWCAVVNRSQADIANRVSMRDAREREAAFFRTNAALYSHVNTGTDTLTRMLASVLGDAVRRQIPRIVDAVDRRTDAALAESRALGKAMPSDRGALVHEVLRACDAFEKRFAEALDSGVGGGESVRRIFEEKLRAALASANLRELYDARNVRAVIDASDGVQPHLVAPEMGIRRLIELGLETMHEPVARCVRAVDRVLRSMVERALDDGDGSTGEPRRERKDPDEGRRVPDRRRRRRRVRARRGDGRRRGASPLPRASARGGARGVRDARRARPRRRGDGRRARGHGGGVLRRGLLQAARRERSSQGRGGGGDAGGRERRRRRAARA
jgi:dynamin 1-like protein